ncbi:MAG: HDOD domain-containing protein [Chitinispirillaceae bacterium]|nr:HDOD domain-containing protein [Chitinispirillaceae bacterium]
MEIFVARQPIFDRSKIVVAYELLYRNSRQNVFSGVDGDEATSTVLANSLLSIGLEKLTESKIAYINFTRKHLLDETVLLFSPDSIVIEILEDVYPDQPVIDSIRDLKEKGYCIALDDFTVKSIESLRPLYPFTDIIKVDCRLSDREDWKYIIDAIESRNISFLAEKIETEEDFEYAFDAGFHLFQGYFFSKPVIIDSKDVPHSRLSQIQLMHEIFTPDPKLDHIASTIERDLSLSYKLLRLINSAAFRRLSEIKSIRQAVTLLGINELRKWLSLIIVQTLGEDKTVELVKLVLARAKFIEILVSQAGFNQLKPEAFLTGLFSSIDVFIGRPLDELAGTLPLSDTVKSALVKKPGQLTTFLLTVLAFENAEWDVTEELLQKLHLDKTIASSGYSDAIQWVGEIPM